MIQSRHGARQPKQDRSKLSLRRLLETAETMLAQDGHASFTLKALSQRAQVSIGSIYHLFDNKQDLIRELQVRFLERVEHEHALVINELRREGLPLRKLVPAAVRDYGEHLRGISDLLRVFMQIAPSDALVAANGKKYYALSRQDFELLILDRRDEIQHPDPERAVTASYNVMYAVIGRQLGLGMAEEDGDMGNWNLLVQDLSLMLLNYLLADPVNPARR
jgi:AcrR family transcriptional regulator